MKKITARFASRCAETGKKIVKGEVMYYDYDSKKCYCMISNTARVQEAEAQEEFHHAGNAIQAEQEAFYENWYAANYN